VLPPAVDEADAEYAAAISWQQCREAQANMQSDNCWEAQANVQLDNCLNLSTAAARMAWWATTPGMLGPLMDF